MIVRVGGRNEIDNIAVGDRVARQYLYRISFDAVSILAIARQFHHLDCGRTDIEADQGARFRIEYREIELQIATPCRKNPLNN